MIGIYGFKNKINEKWYIGQSVDINRRYNQHLNEKNPKEKSFDYALKNEGIENFDFIILKECDKEELNQYEKYYIKLYHSNIDGYNKTKGGKCYPDKYIISDHHLKALKDSWTQERKEKASIIQHLVMTEYFKTEKGKEIAKRHSEMMKNKKPTEETIKKRIASLKKVKHTDDWNKKVSDALSKKVIAYKDKEKVGEYSSYTECMIALNLPNIKGISKVTCGYRKTYKGYYFVKIQDNSIEDNVINKVNKQEENNG